MGAPGPIDRVPLDPRRRATAQRRIDAALATAAHHARAAATARAQAQTIARTWGIDIAGKCEEVTLDSDADLR